MKKNDYFNSVEYTLGYYRELNPVFVKAACAFYGVNIPEFRNACELGYGRGLSINIHASASHNTKWWGCDFMETHFQEATDVAKKSGVEISITADSFSDYLQKDDLPKFEFIALHGIWSWVNDENKKVLKNFVEKNLSDGGVLYVSYNTPPGWAVLRPFQTSLLNTYKREFSNTDDSIRNCAKTIELYEKLLTSESPYVKSNPVFLEYLKTISQSDPSYVAHEYFNQAWSVTDFSEMAEVLKGIGLEYVGQAGLDDCIDGMHIDQNSISILDTIKDEVARESARDLVMSRRFRRDYWVKGGVGRNKNNIFDCVKNLGLVVLKNRHDVPASIKGQYTTAIIPPVVVDGVYGYFGGVGDGIGTVDGLAKYCAEKNIKWESLKDVLLLLISSGCVSPAKSTEAKDPEIIKTENLNRVLCEASRENEYSKVLASPLLGGGIPVGRFQQLFVLAINGGVREPKDLAKYAAAVLLQNNQVISREGKSLSPDETIELLTAEAERFEKYRLPCLERLKVLQLPKAKNKKSRPNKVTLRKCYDNILGAFTKGDFKQMRLLSEKCLKVYGADGRLLHYLGMSYLLQHDALKAIDVLKSANMLLPFDPEVLDHLGVAHNRIGMRDEAEKYYEFSLGVNPNRIETLTNASKNSFEKNSYLEAENYARRALALNYGFAKAHGNLGNALKGQKRRTEAIEEYKVALSFQPIYPEVLNNMGVLLYESGDKQGGIEALQKAINQSPGDPDARNNIAALLKEQGELDESIRHFKVGIAALMQQPYSKPLAPRDYMDVTIAQKALRILKLCLDNCQMRFFLAYGTLLGVIRDGDLLPHDKDMDIGLDWNTDRSSLVEKLLEYGFVRPDLLSQCDEADQWNISVVHKELGITIDFFFFKRVGDKLISGIYHKPVPLFWEFSCFDTREISYAGEKWLIPDPPELYLEEIYGKGWRIPDPYFDSLISGCNRNPESLDVALCFAYNRLFDRIDRGEWKKAEGYCRQILNKKDDQFARDVLVWLENIKEK